MTLFISASLCKIVLFIYKLACAIFFHYCKINPQCVLSINIKKCRFVKKKNILFWNYIASNVIQAYQVGVWVVH